MATTTPASPTPNAGGEAGSTVDPWELASGTEYDPDHIFTRASDNHGHSALMHIKVSPMLHGEIRALIESRRLPQLRTHADIVRDALIHRMIHYRGMLVAQGVDPGTLTMTIQTEVREAALDVIRTKQAQWTRLIDKLDATLNDTIHVGDYDTAWYVVEQNRDPEDMTEPYARRLAEVLRKHETMLRTIANRLPVIEDVPYLPLRSV